MIKLSIKDGKDKSKCILIFSPLYNENNKKNEISFGWWNVVDRLDCCKIFIADTSNNWYLSPSGSGIDINAVLAIIKEQIHNLSLSKNAKIYCTGPSMGGYAAFLYGSLLNAEAVFATSIEETLWLNGSISSRYLKKQEIFPSLNNYINSNTYYYLLVGEYDVFDLYSASLLSSCVDVDIIQGVGHTVPSKLNAYYSSLYGIISLMIAGWSLRLRETTMDIRKIKTEIHTIYNIHLRLSQKNTETAGLFDSLSEGVMSLPLVQYLYSRAKYFSGELSEAKKIIVELMEQQRELPWEYSHFAGIIHRDLKEYERAVIFFEISAELNPKHQSNHHQIVICKTEQQKSLNHQ